MPELDEPELEDDYPVNAGYWYVVDGKPLSSPITGTVKRLKVAMKATVIRRCDAVKRDLPLMGWG